MPIPLHLNLRFAQVPPHARREFVQNLEPHEGAALAHELALVLPHTADEERAEVRALLGVARHVAAAGPAAPERPELAHIANVLRGDRGVAGAAMAAAPPPLPLEAPAADVHRHGADKDTRASIANMVAAFPVPQDIPATLDAVDAFIREHFCNPAHVAGACLQEDGSIASMQGPPTQENAAARNAALRTMSKERTFGEHFGGVRDPRNTYLFKLAGKETVTPTANIVASLWTATESLPPRERLEVRLNIAGALAAAQQNGVHICAPGQLQLIATYMQGTFPHLIDIRTPPKDPKDYNAQLYSYIKLRASYENGPLPEETHQEVRDKATELWNEAGLQDTQRQKKGWVSPREAHSRALELFKGMELTLNDTYDLDWQPPPGTKPADTFEAEMQRHAAASGPNVREHLVAVARQAAVRHGVALHLDARIDNLFHAPDGAVALADFGGALDHEPAHVWGFEHIENVEVPEERPPADQLGLATAMGAFIEKFGMGPNFHLDQHPTVGDFVRCYAEALHHFTEQQPATHEDFEAFLQCTGKIAELQWGRENHPNVALAKEQFAMFLEMTYDWAPPR